MAAKKKTKSRSGSDARIEAARKVLVTSLRIGKDEYSFRTNLFDLSHDNIGLLNEQIDSVPSDIAYASTVLAIAERNHASLKTEFEIWNAGIIHEIDGSDGGSRKTESAKLREALSSKDVKVKHAQYQFDISESGYTVSVLRAYRDGLSAKLQLSQTLSANIRAQREAYATGKC